jgi:hypothetical protein
MTYNSKRSLTLYCVNGRDVQSKEDVLALWRTNYNFLLDHKRGYYQTYTNRADATAKAMFGCGSKDPHCFVKIFYNDKKSFVILHANTRTTEVVVKCSEVPSVAESKLVAKVTYEEYPEMIRYTVEPVTDQTIDPTWVEVRAISFCEENKLSDDFDMQICNNQVILVFHPDTLKQVKHRVGLAILLKKDYQPTQLKKQVGPDRI